MISKVGTFLSYARKYGHTNALILGLFKLFPRNFVLLTKSISSAENQHHRDMVAVDYFGTIDSVEDYTSWQSYGGALKAKPSIDKRDCFIWFVPDWSNVWGGGHYTLFRFANHFASFGSRNIIYIYNNQRHKDGCKLQEELNSALKNCKIEVIVDPKLLPKCTGAIATTWQSAYQVKAFEFSKKKFYFMQDYESLFYPSGTASMQANASYTFGFIGIAGGGWLKKCYESYGGKAQNYLFAADKNIFYPRIEGAVVSVKVERVFFYGRPSTERRCFELGMASLMQIAKKFPDVEIVIAGLDLRVNPPFKARLLGNMKLEDTGILYRSCDIGIAFSGSNLSYLPVELMASGVPVLSNNGPHVEWHCKHLENSYLVDPTPQSVLDGFTEMYNNRHLRQTLVNGGLKTMEDLDWDGQMSKIHEYVSASL
jgi:glycosyltransferase involved in cell wall biosynthesis